MALGCAEPTIVITMHCLYPLLPNIIVHVIVRMLDGGYAIRIFHAWIVGQTKYEDGTLGDELYCEADGVMRSHPSHTGTVL